MKHLTKRQFKFIKVGDKIYFDSPRGTEIWAGTVSEVHPDLEEVTCLEYSDNVGRLKILEAEAKRGTVLAHLFAKRGG